jgi:hypothetical protein
MQAEKSFGEPAHRSPDGRSLSTEVPERGGGCWDRHRAARRLARTSSADAAIAAFTGPEMAEVRTKELVTVMPLHYPNVAARKHCGYIRLVRGSTR